jgi:hypothetical protein
MSRILRTLPIAITILAGATLLLPTTLFYLFGIFLAMAGFLHRVEFNTAWLAVAAFLLLPGYGLYSAWWLLFKFPSLHSVRSIPKSILGGLGVGATVSALFFSLGGKSLMSELSDPKSSAQTLLGTFDWGGGALVVSTVLLAVLFLRRGKCAEF